MTTMKRKTLKLITMITAVMLGTVAFSACGQSNNDTAEFESGIEGEINEDVTDAVKETMAENPEIPAPKSTFTPKEELTLTDTLTINNEFVYSGESVTATLDKISTDYGVDTSSFAQKNCYFNVPLKDGTYFVLKITRITNEIFDLNFEMGYQTISDMNSVSSWSWNGFSEKTTKQELMDNGKYVYISDTGYVYAPDALIKKEKLIRNDKENPCSYLYSVIADSDREDLPIANPVVVYHLVPLK